MPNKKKSGKASRKAGLLFGAVSGASLIMSLGSAEVQAQEFTCEEMIQTTIDENEISGCSVIEYGLSPAEEFGLVVPVAPPPGVTGPGTGGTYTS